MSEFIRREPAMVRSLVLAIVTLAISFGLSITDTQVAHIDAVVVAVLAIITGYSIRQRVTPVS